ncbi:MAG TPA: hypothetical protein VGH88_14905, partial [Streptosporangiaceae bacterium]
MAEPAAGQPGAVPGRRLLSTSRVVFLVIAAAAPMAAMVGNVPLALFDGNGAGLPAAFGVGAVILLCFSVGYAAMSRRVVNTGAFYTYIARALGKPAGVGAAYVAVLAYTAITCGLIGAFGYFTRLVLLTSGVDLPWYAYSAAGLVLVGAFGYRSADLSARTLAALMAAEFTILIVFDVISVARHGGGALPALRGRLRHSHTFQPEAMARLGEPPEESIQRFYFDSVTHDAGLLRALVEFAGADRVLLGT